MSEPDAAPQTYGLWRLIGSADPTGKRSIVRCSACGSVRTVSHEMLTTSHVACTGCSPARNLSDRSERTSFARELASAEGRSARKKQHGG
jgi:hypothetical protein